MGMAGQRASIKAERRKKGSLDELTVRPRTLSRYKRAMLAFCLYLENLTQPKPDSAEGLDKALSQYLCALWEEGDPMSYAADALSAASYFCPWARKRLPSAWSLLGAWRKHELPNRAPPFSLHVVQALAGAAKAKRYTRVGVALLLAFHCLLRTGELLTVKARDISIHGLTGVLTLPSTKSGHRTGAKESVTITDQGLLAMLTTLISTLPPHEPILGMSNGQFRKFFAALLSTLGLHDWGFRPYSLRRGGATGHFQQHGSLDLTAVRGRWNSQRTAIIYINEALTILADIQMSSHQRKLLAKYRAIWGWI